MNILMHMYPGDAGGFLIAQVLVQITVVILMARLLARLGSRWNAAWRHSIYLVALLCVLASPLLSWVMQETGITLVALKSSGPKAALAEPRQTPLLHNPQFDVIDSPALEPSTATAAVQPITADGGPSAARSSEQEPRPKTPPAISLADILRAIGGGGLLVWLLGAAWLLMRWCHGLRRVAALRRGAQSLDRASIAELLRQVRHALGVDRLPPLVTSTGVDRPIMVGLVHPLVILPENVLKALPRADLADILIHECAHAVCRHQLVGLLQRLAGTLFWPHPLVHLLNRELARAREEICDNYVLRHGDAPHYARTLLELSQSLVAVSPKPVALGLFHCHWKLEDRIADLLDRRRKAMIRVSRWSAAALTATFLSLGLLIAGTRVLQAAPEDVRVIDKLVKDFPEKTDLSTPESAAAAWCRAWARKDFDAVMELSCVKLEPKTAKIVAQAVKHDRGYAKNFGQRLLETTIVEVLPHGDNMAVVVFKTKQGSEDRYGGSVFGRIDGKWMSLDFRMPFEPRWPQTARAAEAQFTDAKADFWQRLEGYRKGAASGRPQVIGEHGKAESAGTTAEKAAPAKKAEKGHVRRLGQIFLELDLPELDPQAVQYAMLDHDPVPTFIENVERTAPLDRRLLAKAEDDADREQDRGIQASVSWNLGCFKAITGDKVHLLTGSSSIGGDRLKGKRWIVTKTVQIDGKPVCWCLPVEVNPDVEAEVTLSTKNTFDLRAAYNKAMEP